MTRMLMTLVLCLSCIPSGGCDAKGPPFGFGVKNDTGAQIPSVAVIFTGNYGGPIGMLGVDGESTVGPLPIVMPNAADVSWTDATGALHAQHVQIDPASAITSSNGVQHVYFTIQKDGTVAVTYTNPILAAATSQSTTNP